MSEFRKLVDAIAYRASQHRFISNNVNITVLDREFAKDIITLIGNAYAQGIVKLPNEVGRLEQEPETKAYAHGVVQSLRGWILNRFGEGARTFIALSPSPQDSEKEE